MGKSLRFTTVICIILLSINAIAQTSEKNALNNSRFSKIQIDESPEILPEQYLGHDLQAIMSKLLSGRRKLKDNSTELKESCSSYGPFYEYPKSLIGSLTLDSPLAFSFIPLENKYDENTETLRITLESRIIEIGYEIPTDVLLYSQKVIKNRSAIKTVNHYLVLKNGSVEIPSFEIPLSPAEANQIADSLRILIIGRMILPYAEYKFDIIEATAEEPVRNHLRDYILDLEPYNAILYNIETGQILDRKKLGITPKEIPEMDIFPELPSPINKPEADIPGTRVRVTAGSWVEKTAIQVAKPIYPQEAIVSGLQGDVVVNLTVSLEGIVTRAEADEGPTLLREAAVLAAKQWTFKVIQIGDVAPTSIGSLTFHFSLKK